jgi:hypothetical protein
MTNELDALSPVSPVVTLSTGTEVELLDLKARQFFKLLKIVTHGPASALIGAGSELLSGSQEQIIGKLMGYLVVSIPDTYEEVVDFVGSMIKPAGLREANKVNDKVAKAHNDALWQTLSQDMGNPEVEDLIDLIEAIVKNEAADLAALGKKVMSLVKVAQKTGQLKPSTPQTSPDQNTSEASPNSSTSSVPNTDGQMHTLETSLSVA